MNEYQSIQKQIYIECSKAVTVVAPNVGLLGHDLFVKVFVWGMIGRLD